MILADYLRQRIALVDGALKGLVPDEDILPATLHRAMHYSLFAGGKRLRPILLLAACEAAGGKLEWALPAACAVEMVHTYSLIHDDLPAMDDDDFRRGRPTNHRVFGEAGAILAGDALLTQAFLVLADPSLNGGLEPAVALRAACLLARAAGSMGMVGGQIVDMESEGKRVDLPTIEYIHTHKTGAMILAAVQIGAAIGKAGPDAEGSLTRYGEAVGLAFQIADDILDVVGQQDLIGKDVGSDQQRGKATYPGLLGLEQSRDRALELSSMAVAALTVLGSSAEPLRQIAEYAVNRSS